MIDIELQGLYPLQSSLVEEEDFFEEPPVLTLGQPLSEEVHQSGAECCRTRCSSAVTVVDRYPETSDETQMVLFIKESDVE